MPTIARRTRVIEGTDAHNLPVAALIAEGRPAILRGIGRHLPLVAAGLESAEAAIAALKSFDGGRSVTAFVGAPSIKGRWGYDATCTALNFARESGSFSAYLDRMLATLGDALAPSVFIGSTDIDQYLPGLRASDALEFADPQLVAHPPLVSIWIGNRTTTAAHYDMSNNIAVCMVGRRRFTLFPPDQIANLYPGPLDPTPAGQVVTMVDIADPDLDRFPDFAKAMAVGEIADLEPGDALIYPALWWHQVEALDAFNAMINYWWNDTPAFIDTPMITLLHGLISLRDRPANEKDAWRALFDYYVFGSAERAGGHLPAEARGALGPLDTLATRRLRADILRKMNR